MSRSSAERQAAYRQRQKDEAKYRALVEEHARRAMELSRVMLASFPARDVESEGLRAERARRYWEDM